MPDKPDDISRSNLADLLERHAGIFLLKVDAKGLITYANKKTYDLFGLSEGALNGKSFSRYFLLESFISKNGEDAPAIAFPANKTEIRFSTLTKNGKNRKTGILWNCTPLMDAQSRITGQLLTGVETSGTGVFTSNVPKEKVAAVAPDNREKLPELPLWKDPDPVAKTDEALKKSHERFRTLSDISFEGILILKSRTVIDINIAFTRMFGYAYEEVIKDEFISSIVPEKHRELFDKKLSLKHTKPFEIEGITKGGTIIPLEVETKSFIHKGEQMKVLAFRDITDRKIVQHELQKKNEELQISLESYRGLFDNASDAIYIQNKDGVFLDVNQSVVKMYGYEPDQIIGKTPAFLSAPGRNDLRAINKKIRLAYGGQPQNFEFWGKKKNGEVFPKEVRVHSGLYFGKKVIIAFAQDITERKKAEQKLKESEERFKTLSDISFEGILIHDNGIVLDVNASIERMSGYKREELIGKNIEKLVLPDEMREKLDRYRKEQKLGPFEIQGWHKAKKLVPFEIEIKPIVYQNKQVRMVAVRDISKRKKTEQKLRESEERFKLFSEISLEGILIHDNNIVLDVNKALEKLSGYTREELINKDILKLAIHEKYWARIFKRRKEGKTDPFEIVGINKKGIEVPLEIQTKEIIYKNKKVRMVAIRDISKRKKAELKLQKQDKIIKQTNRELRTFLYRSSHDLRGPLTTLLGLTTLGEIENIDEHIQHYFAGIKNTVFQMMRILRKLNDIYVLFNEKNESNLINFEQLLGKIKFELEKTDPAHTVTLTFNNELTDPVYSNENLLSIIIHYTLENSIIFKRDDVESFAKLTLSKENNHLVITVEDNGIGIPSKIKQRVFSMFFRGSEQSKGNGLGLYLVKKAALTLSGRCRISSRVDQYTKIVISIPSK